MVGPRVAHLDKNNLASTQVFIFEHLAAGPQPLRVLEKNNPMAFLGACPYTQTQTHAERGTNQRNSSPALGRALASAQDRPSSAHRAQNYRQISRRAGADRRSPSAASKLDPFKPAIAEFLEQDAHAPATVIAQRLRQLGFSGGLSILKEYLHRVRAQASAKRAYVRMEPGPGERFEVDWGHFDALFYQGHARNSTPSV